MQTFIVKLIVKLYFIGALAVSFCHIIEAANKLDLYGWQSYTTPFAIDGIAVIGMVMRSEKWSAATRKLGFRVQMTAGTLSLAANMYAGNTKGEVVYGVVIVGLFLFSEWLSDRLVTAQQEREMNEAASKAAKQAAAIEKGRQTRAANKRAAEATVKSSRRRMNKELKEMGVA